MPKRRKITSSERENPANDDCSVPEKLRKQNRRLEDSEIRENLMNESDDNCSDFDDDVGDPDFIYESEHDTESEQSDADDVEVTYPHVEEVYHGEINLNHENEEQEREEQTDRSQDIREQSEEETMVREEQHGTAETTIREIGEQYCEVETRNDQDSEVIDMSGVNAYVLYNKCTNKSNISRGEFLLLLARELVLPEMNLRVYNDRIPRKLRLSIERVIGPADMPESPPPKTYPNPDPGVRKTCAICPSRLKRRTKYCCCKCKKPMCLTCCLQICSDCKPTQ